MAGIPYKHTPDVIDEWIRLRRMGVTYTHIAKKYGTTISWVRMRVLKFNNNKDPKNEFC
ncbi:hypothetical protein ACJYH5_000365 [Vibrio parahaemolyticus]